MNGVTPFLIVLALSLAVLGWGAEQAHAQSGANSTAPESATVTMTVSDGAWNSGETLSVTIRDDDMNRDPLAREEFAVSDPSFAIPSLEMGSPSTLESTALVTWTLDNGVDPVSENAPYNVTDFSKILVIRPDFNETAIDGLRGGTAGDGLIPVDAADSIAIRTGHAAPVQRDGVFYYLNYDLRSLGDDAVIHGLTDNNLGLRLISGDVEGAIPPSLVTGTYTITGMGGSVDQGGLESIRLDHGYPIVIDIFAFGQDNDQRYNDAIYRLEPEETGADTGVFEGTIKYVMLNQINVLKENTYSNIAPITDRLVIVIDGNYTGGSSPRINYPDLGAGDMVTPVAGQQEIPTHSGTVSFDQSSYRPADTATVILIDQDLNTDSDTIDVYTVVDMPITYTQADFNEGLIHRDIGSGLVPSVDDPRELVDIIKEVAHDMVAEAGRGVYTAGPQNDAPRARLLDISFDNRTWVCQSGGLSSTGFMLRETSAASGTFDASFQIPRTVCSNNGISAIGLEMKANYVDFRDAAGRVAATSSSAGIEDAGSVSFDRAVYPVPWGGQDSRAKFWLHDQDEGYLEQGDLTVYIRIDDADYDTSASRIDSVAIGQTGPLKIAVSRGSEELVIATAGAVAPRDGIYDNYNPYTRTNEYVPVELGPIRETAPDTGVFELNLTISYNDGPSSNNCPLELQGNPEQDPTRGCILQGDIIAATYVDSVDMPGSNNTVATSSTFALRDGALLTDESVYIVGRDIILTLIEPDFDLDSSTAETYTLDLIYWGSDAYEGTMGELGGQTAAFDPRPLALTETGNSTGIFQSIIQMPGKLDDESLDRGEEIYLVYVDWGPADANYIGNELEYIDLTIFTSNFGATVELDKKVYTWTDKMYITVVVPDHNFDSDLVDEIGDDTDNDPLRIANSEYELEDYKLVETGTDTGVFSGEVILTGFRPHDADGDGDANDAPAVTAGQGPTDGTLSADDEDGISVSFEYSEDETVLGSALIRWNIGEVTWLEASYPATGTGVVRVVDPDMNLNPEALDSFEIDVFSDTDVAGIGLTVTETGNATGIFEGVADFVVEGFSSGQRLRVAEGDAITAEYEDHTLPDPYGRRDEIDVTGTAVIGSLLPGPAGPNRDPVAPDILINTRLPFPSRITPEISDPDGGNTTITAVTGGILGRLDTGRLPLIVYTPVQTGTDTVTYTVSDGNGSITNGTIYLYASEAGNTRPALDDISDMAIRVGENINFTAVATDADGISLTFGVANAPDGATMNATTGHFSWTPSASQNGSHTVTVFVHDDAGGADWLDIDIYVLQTSKSGAIVDLDRTVYTWTDKVHITVAAPDHNLDSDLADEIGTGNNGDLLRIATRESELEGYKLVETGTDTGVFSGEVILTGNHIHDADGDGEDGDASGVTSGRGSGPTDGLLSTDDEDGISVSFEFSEDEAVLGSALIRWNIGKVEWLKASYSPTGSGVVRVIDPDMNLNQEEEDIFEIDVSSDSDAAGIDLVVTETGKATGIFEGTVYFVVEDSSSGHRLRVAEGDVITAEYEDSTLPDPYKRSDEIEVSGTAVIGNFPLTPLLEATGSSPSPYIGSNVIAPVSYAVVDRVLEAYMSRGLVVFTDILLGSENITYTISEDIAYTVYDPGMVSISAVRQANPNPVLGLVEGLTAGNTTRDRISAGFLLAGIMIYVQDADDIGAGIVNYAVSDGADPNDTATLAVFINEIGNVPPVLSPVGDYSINAQEMLKFRASAVDFGNDKSDEISYRLSDAPAGATITEYGYFRWTPESMDVGNHTFTIIAYDKQDNSDAKPVTIRVLPAGMTNRPPTAPNMTITVARNDLVTIIPAITDSDGDPFRITDADDYDGSTVTHSDEHIEVTAIADAATDMIFYDVEDSRGGTSTGIITVNIINSAAELLRVSDPPSVVYRGDALELSGTAEPGSTITRIVTAPSGVVIGANSTQAGTDGRWSDEYVVPVDAELGTYTVEITDGQSTITKEYSVEMFGAIQLAPVRPQFEPGDLMVFNGTATPNRPLAWTLEDPRGLDIHSESINIGADGQVSVQFQTDLSSVNGTYVLFATQGKHTEIIHVGLGQSPDEPIVATMDRFNYTTGDEAVIAIDGPPLSSLSLIVISSTGYIVFDRSTSEYLHSRTIELDREGSAEYVLDLTGYKEGIYTASLSSGSTQTNVEFGVGFKTSTKFIELSLVETEYMHDDELVIHGSTLQNLQQVDIKAKPDKHVLLTIYVIDPAGNTSKKIDTFSDSSGRFVESVRIPADAEYGRWTISARSDKGLPEECQQLNSRCDATTKDITFNVIPDQDEQRMVILVEEAGQEFVQIRIVGAGPDLGVSIVSPFGEELESMEPYVSDGDAYIPWPVPSEFVPGQYAITATDIYGNATTTFDLGDFM